MKRENEIYLFMRALEQKWFKYPNLRFCQLISNALAQPDIFYREDASALDAIKAYEP